LGRTVNSCVVRVTPAHAGMLAAWAGLLRQGDYVKEQKAHPSVRSLFLMSDQDALGAVLGSAGHAQLAVVQMRSGADIIHNGNNRYFSCGERLKSLCGPGPIFVHAIEGKPWVVLMNNHPSRAWWFLRLQQEVAAYVAHAREMKDEAGIDCPWLERRTVLGVCLRAVGFGFDGLRAWPLAVVLGVARCLGYNAVAKRLGVRTRI